MESQLAKYNIREFMKEENWNRYIYKNPNSTLMKVSCTC
jgi:hypothetical protein